MIKVKSNKSTVLKGKALVIVNDKFADNDTGEEIDLVSIFKETFGDSPFDLSAIQKFESER